MCGQGSHEQGCAQDVIPVVMEAVKEDKLVGELIVEISSCPGWREDGSRKSLLRSDQSGKLG